MQMGATADRGSLDMNRFATEVEAVFRRIEQFQPQISVVAQRDGVYNICMFMCVHVNM